MFTNYSFIFKLEDQVYLKLCLFCFFSPSGKQIDEAAPVAWVPLSIDSSTEKYP